MKMKKHKRRVKLLNKKRFMTVILTFIIVVLASVSVFISASSLDTATTYKSFIVQRGDTLWSIASEYSPEDMDIREYINEIEKVNPISNSFLAEGQELRLPDLN